MLFSTIELIQPSERLTQNLKENLFLATAINTEKAQLELIVMPILTKVRRYIQRKISLFSGIDLNIDLENGLKGTCRFIFVRSSAQFFITKPVVTIIEAKRENNPSGLGRCIATMITAQRFNKQKGKPINNLCGSVTTDTNWKFLKLIQ